jgi:ElaB/YqjD/DUF883 family membrane-anchored ribosome-binding protein
MDIDTKDDLERQIHDLRLEVSRLAERLNATSEAELRENAGSGNGRAKHLSEDLAKLIKFAEDYATQEPGKALSWATALGFLVGLLVSGRRH